MTIPARKSQWIDYMAPAAVGLIVLYLYFDDLIRLLVGIVFLLGPCILFARLKDRIAARFPTTKQWIWLAFPLLLVGGWFMKGSFYEVFGSSRPGALFERGDYETRLFVNAFPNGNESTNYRVPASIHATYEEYEDEERMRSQRVYLIQYLEFPNGGRVSFTENSESLRLKERVSILDDQMRRWRIELTSEGAK